MRQRFLLVENPVAGLSQRRLVDETVALLKSGGAIIERRQTNGPGDITIQAHSAAQESQFDALIAAGGDGTVREAAKGLVGTALALGVIPCGTGNVLAHELGLPREAPALAAYLRAGPARPVCGGLANGELFLLMCGIGLDAQIVSRLDSGLKRRIGKLAYALPILRALAAAPLPLVRVRMGERTIATEWAVVAKSSRYGGPFRLTAKAGLLREGLQLVTVTSSTRLTRAIRLASLAPGLLERMRGVNVVPCADVIVTSEPAAPVQVDGDVIGTTPVAIAPGTIPFNLIVPG